MDLMVTPSLTPTVTPTVPAAAMTREEPRSSFFLGPGRYLLLATALLLFLAERCGSSDWIGDFWIYVATVSEVAASPLHPRNPLLGNSYAFAFFSPYIWVLGLVARWTSAGAFETFVFQGLVNLVLLLGGLYAFVVTWLGRRTAAFYALLMMLFLWGSDPWLFSSFFHLRSLAYVLPYPSTFAAALALCTLAAFPSLSRSGSLRFVALVAPVSTVLFIVHPINALFLWTGLLVASLDPPRPWRHWLALVATGASTFALAMAWPLYPVRELWFHQTSMVHGGNDSVYSDALRCIGPALLGVPWLLFRLRRNRLDPVALLAVALGLFYVYGGLSEKWSYGRLISHAVLMLQLGVADALAAFEERLASIRGRTYWRAAVALSVTGVLLARSWSTTVEPIWRQAGEGDRRWLAFLTREVGRDDIVLTDIETCWYVPAFRGRVVAYPMLLPFVPDHTARVDAVNRFFEPSTNHDERMSIVERYDVRYVLIAKHHIQDWRGRQEELRPMATSVYSQGDYELLRLERVGPQLRTP